jgi:threonine dehydrogenase-like Zn-dependent dehydrogenase
MRVAILYGPRDVRFEGREEPRIIKPTDAVIRISSTCVCGSDLWPYRGIQPTAQPTPMGHEYCGVVEEVGREVRNIKPGQFVVGSFATSDNTCVICRDGYQSSCVQREFMSGAQAPFLRVPLADGTLVATPDVPSEDLIPSLLTLSDVMGTGWFAADAASVRPGSTVVVVGDGAVGLLGVLSAKILSANCFGDYYTRTGLDINFRELVTLSILIALGGTESQVKGHIHGNVNVGNGRKVLLDVITQLLPWVGYPRTLNALGALNEVAPEQ